MIEDGRAFVAPANPYERKLCRLALLAPDIQKRILQGRQPRGLTLDQLVNGTILTAWPAQREAFGFIDPAGVFRRRLRAASCLIPDMRG